MKSKRDYHVGWILFDSDGKLLSWSFTNHTPDGLMVGMTREQAILLMSETRWTKSSRPLNLKEAIGYIYTPKGILVREID